MRLFRFRKRTSRRQLMHEIKVLKAHLLQTNRELRRLISDSNYKSSQDIDKHMELMRRDILRAIESKNIKKDPFDRPIYEQDYIYERYLCEDDNVYKSKDHRLLTSAQVLEILKISKKELYKNDFNLDVNQVNGFNYYLTKEVDRLINPPISF